ncbi:hypothetical protein [Geofilum rubicundum]|uniref:Uncharacterized protein n=1 Tax=Geofilum rubicundum JCM 15548 TaxID=1236989 RepID=A0A0E9LSI7_9BACT|nr:hypothetical protein [Geofilum rubicundum]GAO28106.1 hypothetical protein JCM15548_167 [Geofilum rubicundum JCM 15548]
MRLNNLAEGVKIKPEIFTGLRFLFLPIQMMDHFGWINWTGALRDEPVDFVKERVQMVLDPE